MKVKIHEAWDALLNQEFEKDYFSVLTSFVKGEYASQRCYPPGGMIFSAFDKCLPQNLKVVILGQDPYHGPNQANGLCFSVNDGVAIPPSLRNIFKELNAEFGGAVPTSGNLEKWAEQGVLLLNATLTVRAGSPGSHQNRGWEQFTDAVIRVISQQHDHLVFMLWGAYAQKKGAVIDRTRHQILSSPHPSPLSAHRGFLGNNHFKQANTYLHEHGKSPIAWL